MGCKNLIYECVQEFWNIIYEEYMRCPINIRYRNEIIIFSYHVYFPYKSF